jgi:uncharacterized protein DUF5615
MAAPPAYLDECIDRPVAEALRKWGFDVLTALEAGQAEKLDEDQLQFALSRGRVLITYDRFDFRRLHATYMSTGRQHGGIVAIPQVPPVRRRQLRVALMLDWLGTLDRYRARMFQWNDLQHRLLEGLRLPGYSEADIADALGRT